MAEQISNGARRADIGICVFGASSDDIADVYVETAERLGRDIAGRGWTLVFGSGACGLMGAVARGARAAGGYIVGVVPDYLEKSQQIFECDELVVTETMAQRKAEMERRADAYVVLPGGIGTLDELTEILDLKLLNRLDQPCVLFGIEGFYDAYVEFMRQAHDAGFLRGDTLEDYRACSTVEEAMTYLEQELATR